MKGKVKSVNTTECLVSPPGKSPRRINAKTMFFCGHFCGNSLSYNSKFSDHLPWTGNEVQMIDINFYSLLLTMTDIFCSGFISVSTQEP